MEQKLIIEQKGGFFVWTRTGHKPYYRHDTHEGALKEAKRLAVKHPDRKFIIQEFHEKVFVEVAPPAVGGIMMENVMPMQKKSTWVGVVSGQIKFFSENPEGNVQGLQGSRKFNLEGKLTDDNGTNIIDSTVADVGTDTTSGSITDEMQNNQQQHGGSQQPTG
jgi:hypothetical protein